MMPEADGEGIRLREEAKVPRSIRWQDIERIDAFRRDLFSVDLICLVFKRVAEAMDQVPGVRVAIEINCRVLRVTNDRILDCYFDPANHRSDLELILAEARK